MMRQLIVLVAACCLLSGCVTLPPPQGVTSYASYVGDRYSLPLDEIVVSVPAADKPDQYQNLHACFAAIINPKKLKKLSLSDQYDVAGIVRRSSIRLSAAAVEEVLSHGPVSAKDLPSVRKRLVAKAQEAFDAAFSKWTHSDEYRVEIVLTSLFLTDGSVGRPTQSRQFWW